MFVETALGPPTINGWSTTAQACQRAGVENRFVFYCFNYFDIIDNNNNQSSEWLNETITGVEGSRYVIVSLYNKLTNKIISIPEIRIFLNYGNESCNKLINENIVYFTQECV